MLQTASKTYSTGISTVAEHPSDLAAQVGNTPLLRLNRIAAEAHLAPAVELYAKAEWFNPSGSVKDRPALNITGFHFRQYGHRLLDVRCVDGLQSQTSHT